MENNFWSNSITKSTSLVLNLNQTVENNEDLDQRIEFVFYYCFYPSLTRASNPQIHEKLA